MRPPPWLAFPPLLAISRCFAGSIAAKPRFEPPLFVAAIGCLPGFLVFSATRLRRLRFTMLIEVSETAVAQGVGEPDCGASSASALRAIQQSGENGEADPRSAARVAVGGHVQLGRPRTRRARHHRFSLHARENSVSRQAASENSSQSDGAMRTRSVPQRLHRLRHLPSTT